MIVDPGDGAPLLRCPPAIAGRIDLRGFGVVGAAGMVVASAPLSLLVDLVPGDRAERFSDGETTTVAGCAVARLRLPHGPPPSAAGAVLAALGMPAWL